MFTFLGERWKDLFQADFEVLLYDLTSTYFECDPPGDGKRKFGYSRDKRSDCVQVVIALIVTPDGFPLAYEVMDGNTSDKTTLREFLAKIEKQYGKAKRTWVMDRGIPTEEVLAEMRNSKTPIHYLVGSPRGRLTQLEKAFLTKPWEDVRESVRVKPIEHGEETAGSITKCNTFLAGCCDGNQLRAFDGRGAGDADGDAVGWLQPARRCSLPWSQSVHH
jgi:hypothetical protein